MTDPASTNHTLVLAHRASLPVPKACFHVLCLLLLLLSLQVIFCDSDQVVRADLRELWNMDLQVGVCVRGGCFSCMGFCPRGAMS